MRITRYVDSVSIDLELSEADDLKVACETPEYHLPILTKIANDLARLATEEFETEPEPFPDPSALAGSLTDLLKLGDELFNDTAPSRDSTGDPALDRLIDEHGGVIGAEATPGGLRTYTFEDGTEFYIQPDGTVMERMWPVPDSEDSVAAPPNDYDEAAVPDSAQDSPAETIRRDSTGIPVWDEPDFPAPSNTLNVDVDPVDIPDHEAFLADDPGAYVGKASVGGEFDPTATVPPTKTPRKPRKA